ncbi:low molecular weight protein-tyrosine-phosphatase [Marinicella sp. W31]|uniref:low molecular weight protein-tyrosine-phosphatase n=1 Tax=Marinicella sp. W31 TaxID=3023713 RepID=UPI0037563731
MTVKVLFVCMGNICRSPTAEAVFRDLVNQRGLEKLFEIDSAGTHGYHIGHAPDGRTQKAALARNIRMDAIRSRKVEAEDFQQFDYVIPMDFDNHSFLSDISSEQHSEKIKLMMSFAHQTDVTEVPDPYYGGSDGFELVLDLLQEAAEGLLNHCIRTHRL